MNRCVITIPIYKEKPDRLEQVALERVLLICNHYPISFFCPDKLDVSFYITFCKSKGVDVAIEKFDDIYFQSLVSYSKLLIHPKFYKRYEQYEYLVIYQLDAFIFTDDLLAWCDKGYDYIGAPFFFNYIHILDKAPYGGVGNGGFSLRKIDSLLRVITTHNKIYSWEQIVEQTENYNWKGKLRYRFYYLAGFFGLFNNTHYRWGAFEGYEDYFFGYHAGPKLDWFKLPPYEEALQFSFEYSCKKLYEDNQYQLPTGCHGWWKTDADFWRPHFEKLGVVF